MSLIGSPVSSKLLMCVENGNFNVSDTNPTDTRACSQCSGPAMIVFFDNVSSRTKVMQRPRLANRKKYFNR